ncbi:trafficking protein particle complex subunit 12-like isoform X2 [Limulus polyphemus]|nr:trafficking protein particle complex subunit 12-like isoform X2 [Limulus polyphemus]
MMKSVSDITVLPGNEVFAGDVKGISTESQLALDATESEPVSFTIGGEVEFGVPDEPEITGTNEVEQVLAEPEVNDKKHAISQFFVEDKSGGDGTGKAFFDALNSSGPDLVSPSPIKMSQSHCISDELVCSGVPSKNKSSFSTCTSSSPVMEEETFLTSLGGSDQCQHFDAWIPTELTRQALISMVTSPPGTYFPLKDQLTMPGIVIEEELGDPLKALLTEVDREEVQTRFPLTADSVTQDENGLRQLIKANCYYAAINLTTRLLTGVGQGPGYIGHPSRHTPYSLQLWFTRMALFVKLRKFAFAEVEAEAFGDLDNPDLYYQFYPDTYRGRKGSMVPFAFRVLLAELPQYQGNHQVALDKLYKILGTVQKILNNLKEGKAEDGSMLELTDAQRKVSLEVWQQRECRMLYSIWNCVLAQRDYTMVVTLGRNLLEKDKSRERELCLAMGRIHLQMGDIKGAQEYFNKATSLKVEAGSKIEAEVEELTNRALLAVATNNYSDACNHYKQALDMQPNNPVLLNNMAVCLLYMGHLKESLTLLEGAIQSDPLHCLHEGLLFNTCTLYELESSHSMSKKYDMLGCVAQHVGDNFHISCLKIQLPHKC